MTGTSLAHTNDMAIIPKFIALCNLSLMKVGLMIHSDNPTEELVRTIREAPNFMEAARRYEAWQEEHVTDHELDAALDALEGRKDFPRKMTNMELQAMLRKLGGAR